MDTKELSSAKRELERKICVDISRRIEKFNDLTGINVKSVDIGFCDITGIGGPSEYTVTDAKVELNI